ncbi:MAG TPA: hypothetical protein VIL44_03595 [Micromonospora sp.]
MDDLRLARAGARRPPLPALLLAVLVVLLSAGPAIGWGAVRRRTRCAASRWVATWLADRAPPRLATSLIPMPWFA